MAISVKQILTKNKKQMLYLTVLNFETNKTTTYKSYDLSNWEYEECEQFLTSQGHHLKICTWMIHNKETEYINL